ncbi:inorganic pyrophosphatase-like protein [Medicago truncatula]|uniref:Inorganic pyrophosphatase-like protein n=1 Tax=Medicago truncatula TaxID=3880 RepID=G7LGW6_MEDTR|nr:inorganic pyrophosphatase-like protein [Medicago truncatula]
MVPAIKSAHALGCDLSYCERLNIFSEINTNLGYVNEEGRLRMSPYHFNKASHGCTLYPPNMCYTFFNDFLSFILDRIQNSIFEVDNKRFIYHGDGIGDYCPSLRLRERDFVMSRKNFPVWDLI